MPNKPTYEKLVQRIKNLEKEVTDLQQDIKRLHTARANRLLERTHLMAPENESFELFQSIMNFCPVAIYVKDLQGRYLMINKKCEDDTGLTIEQIIGKTDFDIFPEEIATKFKSNDEEIIKSKTDRYWEEELILKDDRKIFLSAKFPLSKSNGIPFGVCGISTDITERKRSIEMLEEHKNRLELLNSISSQLSSGMSVNQVIEQTVKKLSLTFSDCRIAYSTIDSIGKINVIYSVEPKGMPALSGLATDLNVAPDYLKS